MIIFLSIDTHIHTLHSGDSDSKINEIIDAAKKKGLDGIAITDHNSVEGLKEAFEITEGEDFLIVPGIEISSRDGHILGLGVQEKIPGGFSASKTVKSIREKGGIAISAHPFSLGLKSFSPLKAEFDAIEAFNPKRYIGSRLAERYAKELNIPATAGSDAHHWKEVGLAGIEVDCEPLVEEVLDRIRRGKVSIFGNHLPISTHLRRILKAFSL